MCRLLETPRHDNTLELVKFEGLGQNRTLEGGQGALDFGMVVDGSVGGRESVTAGPRLRSSAPGGRLCSLMSASRLAECGADRQGLAFSRLSTIR